MRRTIALLLATALIGPGPVVAQQLHPCDSRVQLDQEDAVEDFKSALRYLRQGSKKADDWFRRAFGSYGASGTFGFNPCEGDARCGRTGQQDPTWYRHYTYQPEKWAIFAYCRTSDCANEDEFDKIVKDLQAKGKAWNARNLEADCFWKGLSLACVEDAEDPAVHDLCTGMGADKTNCQATVCDALNRIIAPRVGICEELAAEFEKCETTDGDG
ncbi:MAG: hypothetical protein ACE5GX_10245 [Thermoanaerobaculia bacterium]